MSRAEVAFIIPAFNPGEKWLREAVESVLSQSIAKIELIVVDDGSTDGSVERVASSVKDSRVRWIRQDNAGKSAAMNRGVQEAEAPLVAVQDADDRSEPRRAEMQMAAFADSRVGMAFCGHYLIMNGRRMAPHVASRGQAACARLIRQYRMPGHDPTLMARRELLLKNTYVEGRAIVEGLDLILRLGEKTASVNVGGPYYGYRIHPASITKSDPEARDLAVIEVLQEAASRRGCQLSEVRMRRRRPRSDNRLFADFVESVKQQKACGMPWGAFCSALNAIQVSPFDFNYYKPVVHSLLPRFLSGIGVGEEKSETQ